MQVEDGLTRGRPCIAYNPESVCQAFFVCQLLSGMDYRRP